MNSEEELKDFIIRATAVNEARELLAKDALLLALRSEVDQYGFDAILGKFRNTTAEEINAMPAISKSVAFTLLSEHLRHCADTGAMPHPWALRLNADMTAGKLRQLDRKEMKEIAKFKRQLAQAYAVWWLMRALRLPGYSKEWPTRSAVKAVAAAANLSEQTIISACNKFDLFKTGRLNMTF